MKSFLILFEKQQPPMQRSQPANTAIEPDGAHGFSAPAQRTPLSLHRIGCGFIPWFY
ncbi:hypothetical protein [Ruthenibacterium lactatiformans]|uniref:hypothetical protein n=1 Tax=Ruthenibacterium lactatiformans TaxID=1550024 RepID=UPI003AF12107